MGQPTRGKLVVQEGSLEGKSEGTVEFMFNPTEYSISKSNKWDLKANKSGNVPKWEFGGGDPRQLQLELFFDSYLPRDKVKPTDVRKATNQLFNFMMIDEKLKSKSPNSKMGQPPKCRLYWGKDAKNHFDCYITSCNVKYTMFDGSGVPIRATATLQLKEVRDAKELLPTNPTSVGEPGRRVYVVQEGDRLDWIAYQEYGDARQWRRVAEANRITNPLDLRPGMVLAIPPL
jgi:contractile injection system tube protein